MSNRPESGKSNLEPIHNVMYRNVLLPKKAPRISPGRIVCEGLKLSSDGESFDANSIYQGVRAWKYTEFIVSTEEGSMFYGRPGIPGGGRTSNGVIVDVSRITDLEPVPKSCFRDTDHRIGTLVVGEKFLDQTISSISSCDQRDFRIIDANIELLPVYDPSFDNLDNAIDGASAKHSSAWQLATAHMFSRG